MNLRKLTQIYKLVYLINTEYRNINSQLTNEELISTIINIKNEIDEFSNFIKCIEEGTLKKVPDDIMNKAEKEYNNNKGFYKKAKKACMNIIECISDSLEVKKEEFIDMIRLDNDIELIEKLKNKIV